MPCTPYPATFPCDTPPMPPVLVDPYQPTLPAREVAALVAATPPPPDDELRLDRTAASVPEPAAVLLTAIALATLWRARRTVR